MNVDDEEGSHESPTKSYRKTKEPKSILGGIFQIFQKKPEKTSLLIPQQHQHHQQHGTMTLGVAATMEGVVVEDDVELKIMKGTLPKKKPVPIDVVKTMTYTLIHNRQEIEALLQRVVNMKLKMQAEAVKKEELQHKMKIQLQLLHQSLKLEQAKRQFLENAVEKKLAEKETQENEKMAKERENDEKTQQQKKQPKSLRRPPPQREQLGMANNAVRFKRKNAKQKPKVEQLVDVMKQAAD